MRSVPSKRQLDGRMKERPRVDEQKIVAKINGGRENEVQKAGKRRNRLKKSCERILRRERMEKQKKKKNKKKRSVNISRKYQTRVNRRRN